MPYEIKKHGKGYRVCKKTGKCFSKKPLPYKRALSQMRAIQVNEKNRFVQIILQVLAEKNN